MRFLIILLCSLFVLHTFANAAIFAEFPKVQIIYPSGCEAIGYEFFNQFLYLKSKEKNKTRLYLYYNQSNKKILLDHPVRKPSASAGWASALQPWHWSAFMVSVKKFKVSCQKILGNGRYPAINCSNVIKVCQYPKFTVLQQDVADGDYWVVEDVLLDEALETIHERGIILQTSGIDDYKKYSMGLS